MHRDFLINLIEDSIESRGILKWKKSCQNRCQRVVQNLNVCFVKSSMISFQTDSRKYGSRKYGYGNIGIWKYGPQNFRSRKFLLTDSSLGKHNWLEDGKSSSTEDKIEAVESVEAVACNFIFHAEYLASTSPGSPL